MSLDLSAVEQVSTSMAGVVAVDGGTIGLDVSFGAFLAVILGLFIPVVFLVTLFIQSEAQVRHQLSTSNLRRTKPLRMRHRARSALVVRPFVVLLRHQRPR